MKLSLRHFSSASSSTSRTFSQSGAPRTKSRTICGAWADWSSE
jgi:hypothetical protein